MSDPTLFFSYASADLQEAENLEAWLLAPPRAYTVWRDRSGIPPGAPDYYAPILEGIRSSANFLVQLSPRWLRSSVSAREIADAHALAKKLVPVVHPAIPRDPTTAEGRARKSELFEVLAGSSAKDLLEPINWVWLLQREGDPIDASPIAEVLATDFPWKRQHSVIEVRRARWQSVQDTSALVRGAELAGLLDAAFSGPPDREPRLNDAQREFLLASQRQDAAERERTEALHAGTHARSLAFTARERGDAEPDTALLLASEAAAAAAVPESRSALGLLLHRHAPLTRVLHEHGTGRTISGVAISPHGDWFASVDRANALNDKRSAQLLVWDLRTGDRISSHQATGSFTALAWGQRWLAVASRGTIGWLRWDDWKERFRGNTPTSLGDDAAPDFMAFSPPSADFAEGELLAWGTRWGDIGVIRVGDHVRTRTRVAEAPSSDALTGLAWLADGRLLTAEGGRLVVRDPFALNGAREVAAPGRVFSLACVADRWVAACGAAEGHGLLFGVGDAAGDLRRVGPPDLAPLVAWAGTGPQAEVLIGSTSARTGVAMVTLATAGGESSVLLEGEAVPISALAADATGQFIVAGDVRGRVWLWDRARRSALTALCSSAREASIRVAEGRIVLLGAALDAAQQPTAGASADHVQAPQMQLTPNIVARIADGSPDAASGVSLVHLFDRQGDGLTPRATIDAQARVLQVALDPRSRYLYALVEDLGLHWRRWRLDDPARPPETLMLLHSGMPGRDVVFVGDERVVFADGDDLVFMPTDDPDAHTRRTAHDNPVKRLVSAADRVVSLACSFLDTRVDQLRLWAATGEPLGIVTLPENMVDMAIEPDATRVIALGASGSLWDVSLGIDVWSAHATRIAGRSLTAEERRRFHTDTWRARVV